MWSAHLKQAACSFDENWISLDQSKKAWCRPDCFPVCLPSSSGCLCRYRARTACCCLLQPGLSLRSSATPSTPSVCSTTCHTSSNGQGRKIRQSSVFSRSALLQAWKPFEKSSISCCADVEQKRFRTNTRKTVEASWCILTADYPESFC